MPENIQKIIIILLVLIIGFAAGWYSFYFNQQRNVLSAVEAGDKVINYINESILQGQGTASLVEATDEGNVYKIKLKIGEAEYESFVSKDGKLLFPEGISMLSAEESMVKSDFPDVKLFVMSYCPYGLQAQKMFIPVYDLLKGKADMGVYFVNYIMHGKDEIDENLNQYCIQKEEEDKFSSFLSCFVEAGDSEKCFTESGVDKAKIESCVAETDDEFGITALYNDTDSWLGGAYPQFNVEKDLNEQYGVEGSPTIVINGQIVSINPRSPEKFKEVVCQAFNSSPSECSQALSEDVPSAGIGGAGSLNEGSCQ